MPYKTWNRNLVTIIIATLYLLTLSEGFTMEHDQDYRYYFKVDSEQDQTETPGNHLAVKEKLLDVNIKISDRLLVANVSKDLMNAFCTLGHAPSITLWNSTWKKMFTAADDQYDACDAWLVPLSREEISRPSDVPFSNEEWMLQVELDTGLNLFATYGTLVDIGIEPILQWEIGHKIHDLPESVADRIVKSVIATSPCAPDVALLLPVLQTIENDTSSRIYIGVSYKALFPHSVTWYEIESTHIPTGSTVVDAVLTNRYFLLLTSNGLFVSNNLVEMDHEGHHELEFHKVQGPWLEINGSWCYGQPPYQNFTCLDELGLVSEEERIISVAYNPHMISLVVAFVRKDGSVATQAWMLDASYTLKLKPFYPAFTFPASFRLYAMEFHPKTNDLIVYGNQVWVSNDGGNYFLELMLLKEGDKVVEITYGVSSGDMVMMTEQKLILYGKAGIHRLIHFNPSAMVSCLEDYVPFVSHMNEVYLIGWCEDPKSNHTEQEREMLDILNILKTLDLSFPHSLVPLFLDKTDAVFFEYSKTESSSKFHSSNVGKRISGANGGAAIIKKIHETTADPRLLSLIHVYITKNFHYETLKDSPAQRYNIEVKRRTGRVNVEFIIANLPVNKTGWLTTDINKSIWIPNMGSFIIDNIVDAAHAEGMAVTPLTEDAVSEAGYWYMYDLGTHHSKPKWSLMEDECHQTLEPDTEIGFRTYIELDLSEDLKVQMTSSLQDGGIPNSHEIHASFSNPWLFSIEPKYEITTLGYRIMTVNLNTYVNREGKTVVKFKMSKASLQCSHTAYFLTVASACPYGKKLQFHYPIEITGNDFLHGDPLGKKGIRLLYDLAVNYRPPSTLGVDIPTCNNIYNADPSLPRWHDRHRKSRNSGQYKQCLGKKTKADCGCSEKMMQSTEEAFSDCIGRVYALEHPGVVKLNFTLDQPGKTPLLITSDYTMVIEELNGRVDYDTDSELTSSHEAMMLNRSESEQNVAYLNPVSITVSMWGSGLYHFRATIIEGYSYCNLKDEFLFYVTNAPIVDAMDNLIKVTVAILFGGGLFIIYLKYLSMPDRTHELVFQRKALQKDMLD